MKSPYECCKVRQYTDMGNTDRSLDSYWIPVKISYEFPIWYAHALEHCWYTFESNNWFLPSPLTMCSHSDLYDIIMEGQHFECNDLDLNPVIRMAIMRKVWTHKYSLDTWHLIRFSIFFSRVQETLFVDVDSIAHMIDGYNEMMNGMSMPEVRNWMNTLNPESRVELLRLGSFGSNIVFQKLKSIVRGTDNLPLYLLRNPNLTAVGQLLWKYWNFIHCTLQ